MELPFTRDRIRGLKNEMNANIEEEKIRKTADAIKTSILWLIVNLNTTPKNGLGAVTRVGDTKAMITFNKLNYEPITNPFPGLPYTTDRGHCGNNPLVLGRVREIFPDCTFQTDPLETYMIIDWS